MDRRSVLFGIKLSGHMIFHQKHGLLHEKKPKTQKQETESDDKSKKSSEEISRMIHPHDDEPDPAAYMGNYNFPQMLFAFVLGLNYVCLVSE